jgi:glycosyltransferase involved in cell wall biosynthesis
MERLSDFYNKHKCIPFDSVPVYPLTHRAQVWFADTIIALGNNFVAETFKPHTSGRVISLDLFHYDLGINDLSNKDFISSKKRFVWFGSRGAVRKGLDLVLDIFLKRPDLELYVCGLNSDEKDFYQIYKGAFHYPNVHNMGFMNMESEEFRNLMLNTSAVIFPTIWEGGGGAVLNLIGYAGLIPIVSRNMGLDLFGYECLIDEINEEGVNKAIENYLNFSPQDIKQKSEALRALIREKHSYELFRRNLKNIFLENETES